MTKYKNWICDCPQMYVRGYDEYCDDCGTFNPQFNTRGVRKYQFFGRRRTIRQISEITGLSVATINRRLYRGWFPEYAFSLPLKQHIKKHGKNNN